MKKKRIISLLLGTTLLFSSSSIFANTIDTDTIDTDNIELVTEIKENSYFYELEDGELTENAIKDLFTDLDPYSAYYTNQEYTKLKQDLVDELDNASIGVELLEDENYNINIVEVMNNNPAEEAGLQVGDRIVSVDDADIEVIPLPTILKLISGKAGTTVNIGIQREGREDILYFDLVREPVIKTTVKYGLINERLGYISIRRFDNNSLLAVKAALHQFDNNNIEKIIVDVRDNPGGYLSTVKDTLNMLVGEGPLFHVRDSKGNETIEYSDNNVDPNYELAVLTNENSASASEIFAGAIQDREAGIVVGTNTFGKGTVQNLIELNSGEAIKLTVAEYFTANRNVVSDIGITPDIVVEDIFNDETDKILERVIEEM